MPLGAVRKVPFCSSSFSSLRWKPGGVQHSNLATFQHVAPVRSPSANPLRPIATKHSSRPLMRASIWTRDLPSSLAFALRLKTIYSRVLFRSQCQALLHRLEFWLLSSQQPGQRDRRSYRQPSSGLQAIIIGGSCASDPHLSCWCSADPAGQGGTARYRLSLEQETPGQGAPLERAPWSESMIPYLQMREYRSYS